MPRVLELLNKVWGLEGCGGCGGLKLRRRFASLFSKLPHSLKTKAIN